MECCSTTSGIDVLRVPGISNAKKPDGAAATTNGVFLLIATDGKLHVYNTKTCELLKVTTNAEFPLKNVHLCPNDRYVAVRTEEGVVLVYTLISLVSHTALGEQETAPHRRFAEHRGAVSDLAFSRHDSRFLLSVGLDHRVIYTDVEQSRVIFRTEVDVPLTACTMSATDTRLYLGTGNGRLILVLAAQALDIAKKATVIRNGATSGTPYTVHDKHGNTPIVALALNLDGSRLASADSNGLVLMWDASNGQMLSKHQQPEPTNTLRFIRNPESRNKERNASTSSAIPMAPRTSHSQQNTRKFDREIAERLQPLVWTEAALAATDAWVVEARRAKAKAEEVAKKTPQGSKTPKKRKNAAKCAELIAKIRKKQKANDDLRAKNAELAAFAAQNAS
ncbi:hypothetical protein M3Y99_01653800 [Aphelenchoides fujianensis]|nr:hypothetical protein M3Y99_01653800 [Aphelenchoides fujianensis]